MFGFSVTRQTALPIRIVPRFCAGDVVGSKSYLMVVEIHDAAMIGTLTSSVDADQLAAGEMTTQDFTSPVAAQIRQNLAAGALLFFLVKMTTLDFTSPVAARNLAAGAFFSVKMTTFR